ncbi:hypothetical protein [Caulobacter sp. S45]|uniref:hypothetical protein n=1 Tax=Caulobacter sp. S45 TaxID=1641861 RepID=UPI00131BBDAC|nr:hypothetical protein [Caulobacter sp. S45]
MDDAPTLFGLAVIAAYIAHEVVLVWLIFDRRQVFERRTFRLYLGSQVVMAILALAAFWSLIIHSADLFFALGAVSIGLYVTREVLLGAAGRAEVTAKGPSLFKRRPRD